MSAEPIDRTRDPLLSPLLAFLMAAINADVGQVMLEDSGTSQSAVVSTLTRPQSLQTEPDGGSRLSAYRVSTRPVRSGFGHVDHVCTVQFDYVTPSCGNGQLEARWPVLDRVWVAMVNALATGSHEAYEDGADALGLAGVVWVNIATAQKVELFAEGSDFTYPAFRGRVEITWRSGDAADTGDLYPALSFTASIYAHPDLHEPSTVAVSYTPLGHDELGSDTIEETGEVVL